MSDHATPNLPSRDFDATEAFYARLGFSRSWRDEGWMILRQGGLVLEFFPHPGLDPRDSWFSACLRVDDLDAWQRAWSSLGLSREEGAIPRLTGVFKLGAGVPSMFALVDVDGSLIRVLQNGD